MVIGSGRETLWQGDLAVLDGHDIDVGHVLGALLARRALLDEDDVAVDAVDLDAPERRADGFGIDLAGRLDAGRDGYDAVMTAEALGQPGEVVAALVPLVDELDRDVRVGRRLRESGREEQQVVAAFRRGAGLGDQLIRRGRTAGGDDPVRDALFLGLLEYQGDLLDAGGDEQGIAAGSP